MSYFIVFILGLIFGVALACIVSVNNRGGDK